MPDEDARIDEAGTRIPQTLVKNNNGVIRRNRGKPMTEVDMETQVRRFEQCSDCAQQREIYNVQLGLCNSCNRRRLNVLIREFRKLYRPEQEPVYRQMLLISRRKEANPWKLGDEELIDGNLINYQATLMHFYQKVGLPHNRLTTEKKRRQFKTLLDYPHSNLYLVDPVNGDLVSNPTIHALGLAWSYFPHRWSVRCNGMKTPEEVFNHDVLFFKAINKCMKLGTYITDNAIRKAIRYVSGAQSPSNFRPTAAAAIYHHFLPENGGVTWDMSIGFGGRLLGAMACSRVLKYIGTDPSTKTMTGLREMAAELLPWLPELKPDRPPLEVELHQCGSEDFQPEPETVDLCFTSPPYFDCEKYTDEPTQSYIRFPTKAQWMDGFVKQTLANCWRALKPDGHLVINIAKVKTYPDLVSDFKQLAQNNGWENMGEAGLSLYRMLGTRVKKDADGKDRREVFKTEPLLIFRKTAVHDEFEDCVPGAFVPTPFIPVEHGTPLAAN
jgi:hypothetical protein